MGNKLSESFLSQTVNNMLRNKSVFGTVLRVESGDASFSRTVLFRLGPGRNLDTKYHFSA